LPWLLSLHPPLPFPWLQGAACTSQDARQAIFPKAAPFTEGQLVLALAVALGNLCMRLRGRAIKGGYDRVPLLCMPNESSCEYLWALDAAPLYFLGNIANL